jgi:hypothetical protein
MANPAVRVDAVNTFRVSAGRFASEEEPDPAMRIYDPFDRDEQQCSDEAALDVLTPMQL